MDIVRPELIHRRRLLRIIYSVAGLVIVALVTLGLSRLKAAAPTVDKSTVWTDTVKRGPMLREVRGLGTLVPETIRVIPAATDRTGRAAAAAAGYTGEREYGDSGTQQFRTPANPYWMRDSSSKAPKRNTTI